MPPIDLVTSVPNLHIARILAAAGVPYISFLQNTPNLTEIIAWIEGPEIFVQLIDTDLPIPPVDNLIIPYSWFDQFSFVDKRTWWMTDDASVDIPDGMIYTTIDLSYANESKTNLCLYPCHHAIARQNKRKIWIDYEKDADIFEVTFLMN